MNAAAQFVLSFFLFSLGPAAQGTAAALPTFFGWGRTLPMSITLFQTIPHMLGQRTVSMLILKPTKLTIKINYHDEI